MYAYIVQQANSVGDAPRLDVTTDSVLSARLPTSGPRRVLGVALVSIGQRIAGEMPARQAAQADRGCA
jgi:hypothetical protein